MAQAWHGTILGVLPAFLLGLSIGLGQIVRDCSLTCNVGYQLAPLAILAIAALSLPASSVHLHLQARLGHGRWHAYSLAAAGLSFLAFWLATRGLALHGVSVGLAKATYLLFYVWLGVVGAVLVPDVKGMVFELVPRERLPRALSASAGAVVAGGLVGSLVAGQAVPWLMSSFGWRYEDSRDSLLLAMGLAVLLAVPVVHAARLRPRSRGAPAAVEGGPGGSGALTPGEGSRP